MQSIIVLILFLVLQYSPVFSQSAATQEEEKLYESYQHSLNFKSTRNLTAQDRIVDPDIYTVGPGDELTIFFYGGYTREHQLTITPEGSVLIPEFGEVMLGQISLSDAKVKIQSALKQRYKNVDISITLSGVRKLKISIDGMVQFPGIYTISSLDRTAEVVTLAGGLLDFASHRNIRLSRKDQVLIVDLQLSARGGSDWNNPYLLEGDKILIPPREREIDEIEIYGGIKMPGSFEHVPGDRIYDLILLAGGLTLNVDTNSARLVRFYDQRDSVLVIPLTLSEILSNQNSPENLELNPDDRVFIRTIPNYHSKAQVTIEGEVAFPGTYPIKEDTTTLTELIEQAGGFTLLASLNEARMYRFGYEAIKDTELDRQIKLSVDQLSGIEREYLLLRSDPEQGRISINFSDLFRNHNSEVDVTLKDRDRIIIPKVSNTVRIMGKVLKPGLLEYKKGADVDYYVSLAGGFIQNARKSKVRIIKGVSGTIVKPSGKVQIDVGDEILVPEKKDTDWWQVAKDVGLFLANLATVYFVVDKIVD